MTILSKFILTILIIAFMFFLAWPIAEVISELVSDFFWADRSKVGTGAAALGSLVASVLYGFMLIGSVLYLKIIWFSTKVPERVDALSNEISSAITIDSSIDRTPVKNSEIKEEPLTKICPYCAEEVKYKAIKCKHCHSDITSTLQ